MLATKSYAVALVGLFTGILSLPFDEVFKLTVSIAVGLTGGIIHLVFQWQRVREWVVKHLTAAVMEELFKDDNIREFLAQKFLKK